MKFRESAFNRTGEQTAVSAQMAAQNGKIEEKFVQSVKNKKKQLEY